MTSDADVLELALASINKQYGENSVMQLGSKAHTRWPAISTGALTLDLALGIGGLPKGRVVEVFGPESSGKTTLALMVAAAAQKEGGNILFIDAEHALDPNYARNLGVDVDTMYISQPDSAEQALDTMDRMVSSGAFSVVILDSVAALSPQAELNGDVGDHHVGLLPRLMGQTLRKINASASKTETLVIFINQIREKIGVMFGSPETQPGGRALKFFASVRIDIRKIEQIKDKDGEISGVRTKAKTVKNKMAPPFRQAEFDIIYGKGIDIAGCVFDAAVTDGWIKKSGSWFSYEGSNIAQGRTAGIQAIVDDAELAATLRKKSLEKAELL